MEQRSQEWIEARLGSLGASRIADAVARTKSGYGASRANLMSELIIERLTGQPTDNYVNAAMQRGIDLEDDARATYEFVTGLDVEQIGLVRHPDIEWTHASPDGLIGEEGLIEIKVPNSSTHIETILTEKIPDKYIKQIQWQMAVCERQWCDYFSFDNRLPYELSYFRKRVNRDNPMIEELTTEVSKFLKELDGKLEALKQKVAA